MKSFKFCGQSSLDNKLIVKSINRLPMPAPKLIINSVAGADGSYDYSADNTDNRMHFEDRIFELQVSVIGKDLPEVQKNISQYVVPFLLCKKGDLIFDDSPYTVWKNTYIPQGVPFSYPLSKLGQASLFFRTDPFAKTLFSSWGAYDTSNHDYDFLKPNYTATLTAAGDMAVNNLGTWYCRPVLKITGSGSLLNIVIGTRELVISTAFGTGDVIIADFKNMFVTKNNNPIMNTVIGVFGELPPGNSAISVSGTFTSVTIEVRIEFAFMYEAGDMSVSSLQ